MQKIKNLHFLPLALAVALLAAGCDSDKRADDPQQTASKTQAKGTSQQVTLHIHGLDSVDAVKAVEGALAKQDGVSGVKVDQATGKATFDLDSTSGSLEAVIAALKSAGFRGHEGDDKGGKAAGKQISYKCPGCGKLKTVQLGAPAPS